MGSILDSLSPIIAAAFKGKLSVGTLRQETFTARNSVGDPTNKVVASYNFDGIRDNFDASWAARAGIPITDTRVLIIDGSLPAGVRARQGDKIFILNQWHEVRQVVMVDPAQATHTLDCFVVPTPT